MKSFTLQLMLPCVLVSAWLLDAPVSQATTTTTSTFAEPVQYCFNQIELRGELNQTTLDYHLVVAADDQFKNGDVFVGFRLKSKPNVLWLAQFGGEWSAAAYDGSGDPAAYSTGLQLQPVMYLTIFRQPMDLTAFSRDGELLVGYGVRKNEAATVKDSFQDMVSNKRYSVIWEISPEPPQSGHICLTTTEMSFDDGMVGIASQQ
jgi:hypothetical protein